MDGFTVTIWVVRLLFLALLYLFLFGIARALLRDLSAASREPTTELGRLVVVASPAGEPAPGSTLALDAITTLGRDVNNAIVVDDQFASAQHAVLTFRGRTWYVEDLKSTNGTFVNGQPVDGRHPDRLRRRDPARPGPVPARATAPVTASAPPLPRILGQIKPRPRWREARLLAIVAAAILAGSVSLELARHSDETAATAGFSPAEPLHLAIYLGVLVAAHIAQVLTGRRTDQVLLPAVGLLGGISLLLMERLPQDLVVQRFFGAELGLADVQLVWLVLSISIATTLSIVVRSDRWLRLYKYTWAAAGVALLLLTFVLGTEINGQRLTLSLGPISGQPSELLKVILVVFLAGYLSENRSLLVEESTRIGPIAIPPLPYLAPMVAMWAIALGIVVVQRDLGAALLFFAVFLLLLYTATARPGYVVLGILLFLAGGFVMYQLVSHVQTRVNIWIDPFADPAVTGYQIIQALYAFARGGLVGTGLGGGIPTTIPAVETDFPFAALGEELGLVGIMAILGLYLVVDRARPADRGGGRRRLPVAARDRAGPRRRRPGVHHRRGQSQAHPSDRHHAAVHQLRRLVDARQRDRRRPTARAVGQGGRAAAGAEAARTAGAADQAGGG